MAIFEQVSRLSPLFLVNSRDHHDDVTPGSAGPETRLKDVVWVVCCDSAVLVVVKWLAALWYVSWCLVF